MAYFSNSTSGYVLDEQCGDCAFPGDAPCPVLWVQMTYNYDQIGNKMAEEIVNCLVNEKGVCQMKKCMDENLELPSKDTKTQDMF